MNTTGVDTVLERADALVAAGRGLDAVALLTQANRTQPDPEIEAHLVAVRHRAFAQLDRTPPAGDHPPAAADLFDQPGVPEIGAEELRAELIASALQHRGALLVRRLLDPDRLGAVREAIDGAFDGAAKVRETGRARLKTEWFRQFTPDPPYEFGGVERAFANFGSGVLAVDAPRALFRYLEALEAAGVGEVFADYFGERPAISVKKTTLRRTDPDAPPGWHQDGAFLGVDTKALNIWTALTPCGVDAPGIDVFPRGFDHLVPTGGDEIYDWSVSNETASAYDLDSVVRPDFAAGDALIFDHMTLHRTGVDPSMTKTRYAIEMWFFAPSTYPGEQIPICF